MLNLFQHPPAGDSPRPFVLGEVEPKVAAGKHAAQAPVDFAQGERVSLNALDRPEQTVYA